MQSLRERGVPVEEHHDRSAGDRPPNWENIRVMLTIARHGSFRSASEHLDQSINALRRRIEELETHLGVRVFTRHVDGVRLTAEGEHIAAAAEQMELASFNLVRARDRTEAAMSGEVRLAITEGLGTFWIAPRLVEFQRTFPQLLIDMSCAMRSADVLRMEADVSVQLTRPTAKDLKLVRLGRLHIMPFAAKSYVETYGCPRSAEELLRHRIVLQIADQVAAQADYDRYFPGVPQPGFVAIRTNVSSAHYWAIAKGAGLGLLPTYAQAIGGRVVPVDLGIHIPTDIWLTYHPDASKIRRVRRLIDWIIESFDPRQFPWFRDEFIHPDDLQNAYQGEPIVNLFEGFLSAANG
jgi:DNA-binding transcriptional LysR family regulator